MYLTLDKGQCYLSRSPSLFIYNIYNLFDLTLFFPQVKKSYGLQTFQGGLQTKYRGCHQYNWGNCYIIIRVDLWKWDVRWCKDIVRYDSELFTTDT